ncbi:hypothetical protein U9M48_031938 [Paspalum notatum var. saurae]|uniref:non-specific serine/threonine protein kinase n=1 Tax=Paspalum notatum var. saurae TaxID=547442 RepID=A0AAQ3X3X3_PASNO
MAWGRVVEVPTMVIVIPNAGREHDVLEHILDGVEGPRDLPLEILRDITEDFSEHRKIGQGGFGEVYKGVLRNGSVAVKRITVNTKTVDDTQFYNEVKSLLKIINHPNVVRFLGFCANTHHTLVEMTGQVHLTHIKERLLCFDYISNRSLDKHITDELRGLEWNTRYQIIKGICNGLQYLHCVINIIHMDLKPANIMVDDNMVPKITDFGLAILLDGTSPTTGEPCFTRGYCAPEYEKGGKATAKCDIYSLGVIIMELVTGRKDISDKNKVERKWRDRLERSENHTPLQVQQVTKCLQIAERCMKANPEQRPSVSEIPMLLQVELQKPVTNHVDEKLRKPTQNTDATRKDDYNLDQQSEEAKASCTSEC